MKISALISATLAGALLVPVTFAQVAPPSASPPMNMEMEKSKEMPQMQDNIKKMQEQMDKIAKTTNAKERQTLMQEHMQTMQENMKTMRSMGGPAMKGGGMGMGMDPSQAAPKAGGIAGGDVNARQEMMENRMDMMQMMIEQMMQRDKAAQPMPHM